MKLRDQTLQGLVDYTCAQVANLTPDGRTEPLRTQVARHAETALERVGACIDAVRMWTPGVFDYLHSSQYCQYLYYLANTIWREEGEDGRGAATRLFLLNKALNDMVRVARANAGLPKLADTQAAYAPTHGLIATLRKAARFLPFHRLYHSVELTILIFVFSIVGLFIGSTLADRILLCALVPLALLAIVGHFVTIMSSRRVRG